MVGSELKITPAMARLIEVEPRYCDVIVRRWQEYSGRQAVLDGDGRGFEEVADERRRVPA